MIAKLHEIQKKLKAPKNQFNSFGNFYYRNCEDILEAVKPLLPEGTVLFLRDEIVCIEGRYYVKATAEFTDGKLSLSGVAYAREPAEKKGMDESQLTGAASSYARKYALNGLFLIDDTKDADAEQPEPPKPKTTEIRTSPASKPMVSETEASSISKEWVVCSGKNEKLKGKKVSKKFCENQCFIRKECPVMASVPKELKDPLAGSEKSSSKEDSPIAYF